MPCARGEEEYYSWLKALNIDETLPYGQAKESFQWAKDMIQYLREDENNKYYRVLVGFPVQSMNDNVYKERDLVAAALSLVGAHPSLNHKDEFWFSEENPENKWGVLTAIGAKYEDGAVETILQVPKTAVCPICNGRKMTDLLDEKKIVNVSLEGGCQNVRPVAGRTECDGFQFNKKGFSLLTTDILPGIPMARVFPIEAFLPMCKARHQRVKIVGIEKMSKPKEGELSATQDPQASGDKGQQPDAQFQCPTGQHWSGQQGKCIPDEAPPSTQTHTPEGTGVAAGTPAADDTSKKPLEADGGPGSYPWDQCIADMTGRGYSDDSAKRICASIKHKSQGQFFLDAAEAFIKAINEGNFDDCVTAVMASGQDEKSARAICAAQCQGQQLIHSQHELQLAIEIERRTNAEAELQDATVKHTSEITGLKANLESIRRQFIEEKNARLKLEGRIEQLNKETEKYDESMRRWQAERVDLEAKLARREKDLQEALENGKKYKDLAEKTAQDYEAVTSKYREALTVNMALNKQITKSNEDFLKSEKRNEELEERLKSAKRMAKKISVKV